MEGYNETTSVLIFLPANATPAIRTLKFPCFLPLIHVSLLSSGKGTPEVVPPMPAIHTPRSHIPPIWPKPTASYLISRSFPSTYDPVNSFLNSERYCSSPDEKHASKCYNLIGST